MTQLYKLADNYQEALTVLSQGIVDGQLDEETYTDTLEGLQGELLDKAVNVGMHIKNLRSDLSQYKEAKAEFDKKAKSTQRQLDFYLGYLDNNLKMSGIDNASNEYVDIKYKKLPDIVECEVAPPEYSIITESSKPDKVKIKNALKEGESLSFATLQTGRTALSVS